MNTRREAGIRQGLKRHDLEQRRVAVLHLLNSLGNPGLRPRRVPGRYRLSLGQKIFGKVGRDELVETEAAWPIGSCTWMSWGRGEVQNVDDLESGYTPSRRIVPMNFATVGDGNVEMLYMKWKLHRPDEPRHLVMIVTALESAASCR